MQLPQASPSVSDIIAKTQTILERAELTSIETLKPFTELQLQPNQVFAAFELFHEQSYGLNYNKYFAGNVASSADLSVIAAPVSPTGESFLPNLHNYEDEILGNVALTQTQLLEWSDRSEALLVTWFTSCWLAAGGSSSLVPTYFCLEKRGQYHDMATGEALDQATAAQRATQPKA